MGGYVTKYAHLLKGSINPLLLAELAQDGCDPSAGSDCQADQAKSTSIARGQPIGAIGSSGERDALNATQQADFGDKVCDASPGTYCERAFIDPHLHFEIRKFDGSVADDWYETAEGCANRIVVEAYCEWSSDRELVTVLDPEAYLPPLPASWLPRGANTTSQQVADNSGDRRVIEITSADELESGALSLGLSFSIWRPAYFSRYWIANDRFEWQGLRGTRPGVNNYYTRVLCATHQGTVAGGSFPSVPDDIGVRTGEFPAQTRVLLLNKPVSRPSGCDMMISSGNSAYPYPVPFLAPMFPFTPVPRTDISLDDPKVKLEWIVDLESGADALTEAQMLVKDNLDLFTFRAVPGYTYRFCTMSGVSSTACEDETSEQNAAELLIVGPAEPGESGLVEEGPELVRDANGLAWTVPASDLQVETYAVVVRRRARYEGEELPDYTYRLRYTVPDQPACDRGMPTQIYCKPDRPTVSGTENITESEITVTFGESYRATRYEMQLSRTGIDPVVHDVGGAATRSATLNGLDPSVEYTIRVRGRNVVGAGAWSNAVMATTLQACSGSGNGAKAGDVGTCPAPPPVPTNVQVADVTGTSAELSWDAGDSDLSYDVRAVTGADCKTDVDAQVEMRQLNTTRYELTMLNATMDYLLCVRAVRTTGTAPNELTLRSDWASAPSKPEPPANARVTDRTTSSLTLSWTEVSGFSYKVQIDSGGELTGVSNSPHTFSLLAEGSRHTLQVRGIRGTLKSDWTQPLTGTTLTTTTPPPPPSCPSPRPMQPPPQGNRVTLSTSYKWVERGTTAHEQVTKELRDDYKPYEWQGHPDCFWQLASAWVEGTPYTDGPRDTGQSEDKPTEIDKESAGTKLRWVEGSSEACEYEDELERSRARTVTFSMLNGWDEGPWGPWGARYVIDSEATGTCESKPADPPDNVMEVGLGTATRWLVSATNACPQTEVLSKKRSGTYVFSSSGPWVVDWDDFGPSYQSGWRMTGTCLPKPPNDSVPLSTTEYRDGPCTLVGPPPMFIYYRQRRTVTNHYYRPHVWSDGQERWIDGTRETTPYNTVYGAWANIGSPLACPLKSADGGGGELVAGKNVLSWDNVQIELTVPADATVSLSWRERDAGPSAAVLTVSGEGELVVEPESPLRTTRPPEPQEAGGNVLSQIAASLRLIESVTEEP